MNARTARPCALRFPPLMLLSVVATASAATTGHGAHIHGQSRLDVVIEGGMIELQLSGPVFNFVGFEHAAEGAGQRAALTAARDRLGRPVLLFRPSAAAGCTGEALSLDTPDADAHADEGGRHGDHEHQGDGKHAEGHQHEHETHGHDEVAHASTDISPAEAHERDTDVFYPHSEWQARYRFSCANPAAIETIEVAVFEHFPDTLQIDFQLIGPTVTGGRLDPANRILTVQ